MSSSGDTGVRTTPMDGGGADASDPVDPPRPVDAPPPPVVPPSNEYSDIDPIASLSPREVVGDGIYHHIHSMNWRADLGQMEIRYAMGGRSFDLGQWPFDPLFVIHPWSVRLLTSDDHLDMLYRLSGRTSAGMNWCKTLDYGRGEVICQNHEKKASDALRFLVGGDGITSELDWPQYGLEISRRDGSALHRGFNDLTTYDAIKRVDGTVYTVSNRKRTDSYLIRIPPGRPEAAFVEVHRSRDEPSTHMMAFAAWSNDQNTIYFTTLGDMEERVGQVWAADVNEDGSLQAPRRFVAEDIPRPWGLTFDAAGNLYIASGFEVRVYDAQGSFRGAIETFTSEEKANFRHRRPVAEVTALAFGGQDGRDLYVAHGISAVVTFGNMDWANVGRREYRDGRLVRLRSEIPGAWVRRWILGNEN